MAEEAEDSSQSASLRRRPRTGWGAANCRVPMAQPRPDEAEGLTCVPGREEHRPIGTLGIRGTLAPRYRLQSLFPAQVENVRRA